MNRVSGIVRMYMRDKTFLMTPWLIVSISFLANLTIGYLFRDEPIYTGGIASIYIYMLVMGLVLLPQTFPFAIGLSTRRTDYFWGTTATITGTSVVFSIVLLLLSLIESKLTGGWGVDLHFFHLPYFNDGPAWAQLWIFFALLMNMFFLGFAISSVHRRFGKSGLWIFMIAAFVVVTVALFLCGYYGWWGDIFSWLAAQTAFQLSLWMFALAVLYAIVAYMLLRKATV